MLEELFAQISALGLHLWGPFIVLILCGVGMPLPEDLIIVTAAVMGAISNTPKIYVIGLMFSAVLIGDSMIFMLGHKVGKPILKSRFGQKVLKENLRAKATKLIFKHGAWGIFIARFLPGLRAPFYFTSGSLHMRYSTFVLMDGLAAMISVPLWVYFGYWGWNKIGNLHKLDILITEYQTPTLLVLLALLILSILVYKLATRSKKAPVKITAKDN